MSKRMANRILILNMKVEFGGTLSNCEIGRRVGVGESTVRAVWNRYGPDWVATSNLP